MRNYKEVEHVINNMVRELQRIAGNQTYSYHHSLEYQVKAIKKANTDIDYYQDEANFVI